MQIFSARRCLRCFGLEGAELYMHEVDGRNLIIPAEAYGVKMLSIGFLIDPGNAAVWRGAMASNALKQLIEQADWGELDYFLIDMPPAQAISTSLSYRHSGSPVL